VLKTSGNDRLENAQSRLSDPLFSGPHPRLNALGVPRILRGNSSAIQRADISVVIPAAAVGGLLPHPRPLAVGS
jgi:hypothetical protein